MGGHVPKYAKKYPDPCKDWKHARVRKTPGWMGKLLAGLQTEGRAIRNQKRISKVLNAIAETFLILSVVQADLAPSNNTHLKKLLISDRAKGEGTSISA